MRIFEFLILISLLLALVIHFFANKSRRLMIFSSLTSIISILCHLLFEGARFQMVPSYLVTVIVLLISILSIFYPVRQKPGSFSLARRIWKYSAIVFTFLLMILITIPPILFPVFRLPDPSGPLSVGTTTLFFKDTTRLDIFSGESNKYREISARVWYPAIAEIPGKTVPYMQEDEAQFMAEHLSLPPFFLSHFKHVKTASYLNATPMDGSYPVVLYSPSGDLVQNTALFQELASHGYIVISVGHPYWNAFYYDSEGQAIQFDSKNSYYQSLWVEENSEEVNTIKEKVTTAANIEEKREAQKNLNSQMPLEVADIRLWAEDLSFLLDRFGLPDHNLTWLTDNMDSASIGVIGFSKGGAAAGQFSVSDPRCKCAINLSGFMFGDALEKSFTSPFMILENMEEWCADCTPICEVFYENAASDAYMVRIKGAQHGNFSDWSLVGRFLKIIGLTGPIKGNRCLEIQNHYVQSFFDRYLKGIEAPLLNETDQDYPEVVFNSRNTRTSS